MLATRLRAPLCALVLTLIAPLVVAQAIGVVADIKSVFMADAPIHWAQQVSAVGAGLQIQQGDNGDAIAVFTQPGAQQLLAQDHLGDSYIELDYLLPQKARARLFVQGRYALDLPHHNNEWSRVAVEFRAPRFDEARNKIQPGILLAVRVNGERTIHNQLLAGLSADSLYQLEVPQGHTSVRLDAGQLALRNVQIAPADFSAVNLPAASGEATNQAQLVDYVALGKELFDAVGCHACHLTGRDGSGVSSGPNLFGLFGRNPRDREVSEGGEGHRFTIKTNRDYLHTSVRDPGAQLAITESGTKKGEAYLPIMPAFPPQVLSEQQLDAIGAYLATLNTPLQQGPVIQLVPQTGVAQYNPMDDRLQLLVSDGVRVQRGPMAGVSGRAIHVGTPWGVHYSFDPRNFSFAKIWQGGFLDMSGEHLNRGGKGLQMGHQSREIALGEQGFLVAPLSAQGKLIDFSFKEALFGDVNTIVQSRNSKQDHLALIAAQDAQFLGYTLDSRKPQALPTFSYRIGKNRLQVRMDIQASGEFTLQLTGDLPSAQAFAINTQVLQQLQVNKGELSNGEWRLPAATQSAQLQGRIALASQHWLAQKSTFNYRQQPLRKAAATANLPAGFAIESYYPPQDNYGRDLLFEALGLALAEDGTLVVATRTAGIWRLVKGQWHLFAEGTFDSLGVVVEDKKGLQLIVGQKPELTRIRDTDGDGIADSFETLFDAHSFHSNYHAYMHGPVRGGDGSYYVNINLADGNDGSTYNAGGKYMGSAGGFAGWNIRVAPDGSFTPWAYGLRSPAGMASAPDGRIWYTDNQGEYMSTSKLFLLEQDAFYGHPSSLIDLPGKTPSSPDIAWSNVKQQRAHAAVLLPHNRVANSPGNPAWVPASGFGPFAGQMLVGDQTQSNLLRIALQTVNGKLQGSVMPFIDGLESGVMRPLFLPDGSLLLGQTGRGWQAKGGHVASLQHIVWDGKTIAPALHSMEATATGFMLHFTQPLAKNINEQSLAERLQLESWIYRDAADYGSDELDLTQEAIKKLTLSYDRKTLFIELQNLQQKQVHPEQTARVYYAALNSDGLFAQNSAPLLQAYYTLYEFVQPN